MRTFAALVVLAACSRTAEQQPPPQQRGAFALEDVVSASADEVRIAVDRTAVPLEEMGMGRFLAGLPMHGLADVEIDLAAPVKDGQPRFSQARGHFAFTCEKDCRVGDDVARLVLQRHAIDVGHVDLQALALRGIVENGHAKLTQWQLVSPDIELEVDVDIALADDLGASAIDGCVRFAPVAGLDKRRPQTWAVVQTTGASVDDAGRFSIRLAGTLGAPKRLAQPCEAGAITMR